MGDDTSGGAAPTPTPLQPKPGDYKDAWLHTWQSQVDKGTKSSWPARLLPAEFGNAIRVLSVSYDSSATKANTRGRSSLVELGDGIASQLMLERVDVGTRPVFFVGHSLGGLVLKQVYVEIVKKEGTGDERSKLFRKNLQGAIFYGTPHGGARLTDLRGLLPFLFKRKGKVLGRLALLGGEVQRLNGHFDSLRRQDTRFATLGFYEKHSTPLVVQQGSAIMYMDQYMPVEANHYDICKHENNESAAFQRLKDFLKPRIQAELQSELESQRKGPTFIGRKEELAKGEEALRAGKVLVIRGGPGEGKTRLAAEIATRFSGTEYARIDLGGGSWDGVPKEEAQQRLGRLLLSKIRPLGKDEGVSAWEAVFDVIESAPGVPRLVTYDNAELLLSTRSFEAGKAFEEMLFRLQKADVRQIVTTWVDTQEISGVKCYQVTLGSLSEPDAMLLLQTRAPSKAISDEMAVNIVKSFGCNAKVLEILGGFIESGRCTSEEVIQNHIKAGAEGNSRKASGVPQLLKAVKEFFSMYMNAESLGWMKAMSLWHSFTKEEAGLELWALKERVQESIIQCTSHGGEKESIDQCTERCRYSMHFVVREAAKELLEGSNAHELVEEGPRRDDRQLEQARERFVRSMAEAGERMHRSSEAGDLKEASSMAADELGNALGLCAIPEAVFGEVSHGIWRLGTTLYSFGYLAGAESVYCKLLPQCTEIKKGNDSGMLLQSTIRKEKDPVMLSSWAELAKIRATQARIQEAEDILKEVVEAQTRVLGAEDPATLASRGTLGLFRVEQGDLQKAEETLRRVMLAQKRVLGAEAAATLTTMGDLGFLCGNLGNYEEAEQLFREVVGALGTLSPAEALKPLKSLAGLARIYAQKGNFGETEKLLKDLVTAQERLLPEDHPLRLSSKNELAQFYASRGSFEKAEKLLTEVLNARKGEDHLGTLTSKAQLAYIYASQGRFSEAEKLLHQVVEAFKRVVGDDHRGTRDAKTQLAALYGMQSRYEEAEQLLKEAGAEQPGALAGEHSATAASKGAPAHANEQQGMLQKLTSRMTEMLGGSRKQAINAEEMAKLGPKMELARIYCAQGKFEKAEGLFREVLEVHRQMLGPTHVGTVIVRGEIARVHLSQGRLEDAEKLLGEVVQALTVAKHPALVVVLKTDLARVYRAQGRYEGAEKLLNGVLEAQVTGAEEPNYQLAIVYIRQGRFKDAEELLQKVLGALEVMQAEYPRRLPLLAKLAHIYELTGRFTKAEDLLSELMGEQKRVTGDEHLYAMYLKRLLAAVYRKLDRSTDAEELLKVVVGTYERVLGPEHPRRLRLGSELARVYKLQGRLTEAKELLEKVGGAQERVLGAEHPDTLASKGELASVYMGEGSIADAKELLGLVVEAQKKVLGLEHPDTLASMGDMKKMAGEGGHATQGGASTQ